MLRNSTRNIPAAVRRRVPSVSSQTGTRGIKGTMASAYNTPAVTPLPPTVLFQPLSFSPNQPFLPSHVPTSNVSRPQTDPHHKPNDPSKRGGQQQNRSAFFFFNFGGWDPKCRPTGSKKKKKPRHDSGVCVVRSSGGLAPNPLLLALQTLPVAVRPPPRPGFYELIYRLLERTSVGQEASTEF